MADIFQEKALEWDNPLRVEKAREFAAEVKKNIDLGRSVKILDFGCGTGLVGLNFTETVEKLLMVDNSQAMLAVLKEKIKKADLQNIEVLEGDINELEIAESSIDIIVSLMAFHHVKDISRLLKKFKFILKKGGYIVIGDLCKEDGSFHGKVPVEHRGFDLKEIKELFLDNNLTVKNIYNYNIIEKSDEEGKINSFEQFILIACS